MAYFDGKLKLRRYVGVKPTAGSLSRDRHKLKSGPLTVAESALRRMLMMTSGLLS
jgi:hypothetical protein